MTRLMPEDWAVSAYEAALRGDEEGAIATIAEIASYGSTIMERILHAWMDRTMFVMQCLASQSSKKVSFVVEAQQSTPDGPAQISPEVAWGGQLFTAHVKGDAATWTNLFHAVPAGDTLNDLVATTLRMLAISASAAGDAADEELRRDPAAQMTPRTSDKIPPMTRAARMVRAHLN